MGSGPTFSLPHFLNPRIRSTLTTCQEWPVPPKLTQGQYKRGHLPW